ncbi:MAG: chemotaxis protein CheW [Ignavibacteriales bacterium]|nr:chemotaxis protein CheW [Ignavibacteriales bacterium]
MSITRIAEVRQYLTFTLDTEMFAVDVEKVREVLDYTTITKIPHMPMYMRGVLNLRGSVVPVIDLRLKFGMPGTERQRNTCIIVLEIQLADELLICGALADAVQEVFEFSPEQIEPAPKLGTKYKADFLQGIGKREEKFILILDIDSVFTTEELTELHQNSETGSGSVDVS